MPKEYIPGVEKGVQGVWDTGVLIGFPMVDTKVTLYDGDYHEVDSSTIAFEIAARTAMREGANKAGVKLLEPIMDVEVVSPGDFVGGVIGDLNSRRGQIRSQDLRATNRLRATCPANSSLWSRRSMRRPGDVTQFAHSRRCPQVAEEVKANTPEVEKSVGTDRAGPVRRDGEAAMAKAKFDRKAALQRGNDRHGSRKTT